MTNSATASTHGMIQGYARPTTQPSDEAPMAITRLSGWINAGEVEKTTPAWIIPTRRPSSAR